jgi:hypothetical protein
LACALGDAELFLGALWLLAADEVWDSTATEVAAGAETADASMDAIAASLGPAAAAPAGMEVIETEEIAWTSSAGASTTVDWVAVTSGIGAASLCGDDEDCDGREKVSIDEPPETKDCEAPMCLGLTAYRTTATPTAVPRIMVSICSMAIFLLPWMICGGGSSFGAMSKVFHNGIKLRHTAGGSASSFFSPKHQNSYIAREGIEKHLNDISA